MRQAFAGLIVCWLAVCQPQADAQFFGGAPFGGAYYGAPQGGAGFGPRQGSVSRANTNAYERQVDLGNNIGLTQGLSNSRAVTRQNGQRVVANSQAATRGIDLGGLQIGNTLTRTRTNANGAVSGGIANQLRVGNLGLGASLSPDNLRQGFGLQRGADGNARLGLGLISLDLDRNAQQQQQQQAAGQAQVNAQGHGARANSNSNSQVNQRQYGGVNVRETISNSNAFGATRHGQTSANAGGFGGNAATHPNSLPRYRRAQQHLRPKRRAQFVPFGYYPQPGGFGGGFAQPNFGFGGFEADRPRRQFQRQRQQVQAGGSANAKGRPGFNQQAASNNFANSNPFGFDAGSSSIGSNLAQDGSRGQLSSANTNQQGSFNANGFQTSNGAQSQALNFRPGQQQASSSNANTKEERNGNRHTIGSNSGSTATNNNQFGSSSNIANTDTSVVRDGNGQIVNSGANSQSIFQGNNGLGDASALTNANINSQTGPNGFVSNSASSSASATATNGQSANANANANAGGGFNGGNAGANAAGGGGGFGGANAGSNVSGGAGPQRRRG
ncbi:uncharacterized transmembrane protein DDB_G0289901 [Drosophila busckii]|uniref:uncharacterized transmembrane protein DDB_G0289901 n=1 Tax=Drosophila busckii TaxID=30019 RepID=UPI00083F074B|nr:uncharacterized transmembrane protein DDB_G0289901 [Drosophila busckii]